jgi:hypothetical protein
MDCGMWKFFPPNADPQEKKEKLCYLPFIPAFYLIVVNYFNY